MPTSITFKQGQIRALREGLGLSQKEFAQRLGVSKQAVSLWETGQVTPTLETIAKMASEFGAKIESFWQGAGR